MRHFSAKTINEAVSLLSEYGEEAKIIAGGTDVIGLMRSRVISPKALVNIKTLPGLADIKEEAGGLKIGALTTIKDVETSAIIRSKYNILADAARSVAAPQIRNMGTISGNLCQEVRCWYYRRSLVTENFFFCYRKGGRLCDAAAGQNASHAVIGSGKCFAVSPSDFAPALIALGAKVKIVGSTGERVIRLEELYPALGNILEPDELITEIQTQAPTVGSRQRYLKFRQRKAIDFAVSSVTAVITIKEKIVSKARIILGGVSPTPHRAIKAEEVLQGETISERLVERAVSVVLEMAKPLAMNAHKMPITEALLRRALLS